MVTNTGATESGEDVVVNQHYQPIARLKATDGKDAWVTANKNIPMDLSKYGGAYNGALIDSAVQEYNLKTGKLLRNWDALQHIPLSESQASLPTNGFPWDAYHVNSIDLSGDGSSFLVSMRNTWAAYMVDSDTGGIEWTLGGKHSSFQFGPGAAFQWQHDVRLQGGGTNLKVSLYDDHCCQLTGGGTYVSPTGPSRGLVLSLNQQARTATLVAQYGRDGGFTSDYMGDTQPLANGNVFVGFGSEPYFAEYSRSGKLLFEGELPGSDLTYRATVEPWVGLPLSPPVGAARTTGGSTMVYASWNGATEVVSWRVLAVAGDGRMTVVATPVGVRDGDRGAAKLQQLRGPSAGRRWPGDRGQPALYAGSLTRLRLDDELTDPPMPHLRSTHATSLSTRARGQRLDRGHHAGRRDRLGEAMRQMSTRRSAGALLATVTAAIALSACGGTSSASTDVLDADSAASAAASSGAVTVSPLPGTPDASPQTQISFLGGAGTQVSDVHVVGSRSGNHGGSLRAYSTGTGESFLPSHPFRTGERVRSTRA